MCNALLIIMSVLVRDIEIVSWREGWDLYLVFITEMLAVFICGGILPVSTNSCVTEMSKKLWGKVRNPSGPGTLLEGICMSALWYSSGVNGLSYVSAWDSVNVGRSML